MPVVYLGLGANLGEPRRAIYEALSRLEDASGVHLLRASPLYRTAPLGPPGQPFYLNLVAEAATALEPRALLTRVKQVEAAMGRTPTVRWGPRLIDVDLLLYGSQEVATPELSVPHLELGRRRFVLRPLAELAPGLRVPGLERTVAELLAALPPAEPEECVEERGP